MSDFEPPVPVTYSAARPRPGNGLAVASLVLGIISIPFMCVTVFIAAPCGLLAIIFGAAGRSRARAGASGGGMALAGLVCGTITVCLYAAVLLALIACGAALLTSLPGLAGVVQEAAQQSPAP